MVERAHRQLKDALRAHEAGADWPDHLAWVLLGLRAAPKESSGLSSAQLVFGQPLILPGELKDVHEAPPDLFNSLLQSPEPPPTCQPRTYVDVASSPPQVPVHLQQARFVYIRRGGMHHSSSGTSLRGALLRAARGPQIFHAGDRTHV